MKYRTMHTAIKMRGFIVAGNSHSWQAMPVRLQDIWSIFPLTSRDGVVAFFKGILFILTKSFQSVSLTCPHEKSE